MTLFLSGALAALGVALALSTPSVWPSDVPARPPGAAGHARLDVQPEGRALVIHALFVSVGEDQALRYTLEVTKEGRSRSTSRQSGTFAAVPGQEATLATSRVGVAEGDRVTIVLTVLDGDLPLDTARFTTTATP